MVDEEIIEEPTEPEVDEGTNVPEEPDEDDPEEQEVL
jgi:hypothetical protein